MAEVALETADLLTAEERWLAPAYPVREPEVSIPNELNYGGTRSSAAWPCSRLSALAVS
jgi:hypothetical protein